MPNHFLILVAVCFFAGPIAAIGQEPNLERAMVIGEVSSLVREHFFDETVDLNEWRKRAESLNEASVEAGSRDDLERQMNSLLATLETSHTYYYSINDPKRYQLLGIFSLLHKDKVEFEKRKLFLYDGIGMDTRQVDGQTFVSAVYEGLPAFNAGLRFGDRIKSVDGDPFHRMNSFQGKTGKQVTVSVERESKVIDLPVRVAMLDGRTMFAQALEASMRVIKRGEKQIGYVHVWSYAGAEYQEKIRAALLWGELSMCDALVFDIRDGWGGADLNYLNLFREPIATVTSTAKNGDARSFSGVWQRPVVLLTNGGSTSGKELFSFGFKKLKLGKVIGETTAGAVVAGRSFLLSNGDVLYLAVSDVHVDGIRLEGRGVEPDIAVDRPLKNASAEDPQLERAIKELLK